MKKVIRQLTFETNSSSQHCIVVTKNDVHVDPDNILWDPYEERNDYDTVYFSNGKWGLRNIDDGYGRYPFQFLITFEDKFKYAMCEYLGHMYIDDPEWDRIYNKFKKIAKETIPGFEDFYIYTKDVDNYLDEDGNSIPHKDLHYDYYNNREHRSEYFYFDKDGNRVRAIFDEETYIEMPNIGSIDHQSAGLLKNFIKDKNITLKEFLTNKKYVIVVDGDEYCEFDKLLNSGFINKDFIVNIYSGRSNEDVEFEKRQAHEDDLDA